MVQQILEVSQLVFLVLKSLEIVETMNDDQGRISVFDAKIRTKNFYLSIYIT